jgi:hypothetical protein
LGRISNNNNAGRNHTKPSPTLYAKTSPTETTNTDQIFYSANSISNVQKDDSEPTGLPNLKNVKKSEHKAMI